MEQDIKKLDEFTESIKKSITDLQPHINETIKRLNESSCNLTPKLIKECKINKKDAKVMIYPDSAIRIEFADKDYADKFYKELK